MPRLQTALGNATTPTPSMPNRTTANTMAEPSQSQSSSSSRSILAAYQAEGFFDELVDEHGRPRPDAEALVKLIDNMPQGELTRRQEAIERALYQMGITFTVYSDDAGTEKIMPFDVVPRIVSAVLWRHVDAGLKQRIKALNHFLCRRIYSNQQIVKEGNRIPRELIDSATTFLPQCMGLKPFHDVWCHITGTDLIRDHTPVRSTCSRIICVAPRESLTCCKIGT